MDSLQNQWRTAAVALLIVVLTALWYCWGTLGNSVKLWNRPSVPSWVGAVPGTKAAVAAVAAGKPVCDIDTRLIHNGLLTAPRFRDTVRWWTGTWVGQVPFYRPLTSLLFWAEWKLWGDNERGYDLLTVLLHLWAVFEYGRFSLILFRRFDVPDALAALITGLAFVTGLFVLSNQQDITREVFALWKNQPDALSLALFSLTLRTYLQVCGGTGALPGRRMGGCQRAAPLIFYILLCLTKEAGAFLPLLLPILEAKNLSRAATRRAALSRIGPFFALTFAYLVLRGFVLQQVLGYTYGSNKSWDYRLGVNLLGPVSEAVFIRKYYTLALAIILGGGVIATAAIRRSRTVSPVKIAGIVIFGMLFILTAAGTASYLDIQDPDPINGLLQFWDTRILKEAVAILFFCATVEITAARRSALAFFAYVWALLALALTLFSPSVLHRYYLVNAGFALLVGAGAALWLSFTRSLFSRVCSHSALPCPAPRERQRRLHDRNP